MDTDLQEPDTNKRNPSEITRCQSMMVNKDQHWANWIKIRETSNMPGDSACSQWVEQSARKTAIPHGSEDRARRYRNLTKKGLKYKKESLREKRRKISSRLIKKYHTVEDLLVSYTFIIAVVEKMKQFKDLFKMLLDAHQEYNQLLADDERGKGDDWFDDVDTIVCQEEGTLLAEGNCSDSQIINVFIQKQQEYI